MLDPSNVMGHNLTRQSRYLLIGRESEGGGIIFTQGDKMGKSRKTEAAAQFEIMNRIEAYKDGDDEVHD